MAPAEASRLKTTAPGVVRRHRSLHILRLDTVPHPEGGQACVFLRQHRCAIHPQRPTTCRRFPFGLVATPAGLRVTTEHRCPCRSLGPRPLLSLDDALPSLYGSSGRLQPDLTLGPRVRVEGRRYLSFQRFVAEVEGPLLEALLAPAPSFEALGAPYPDLDEVSWGDVAHLLRGYAEEGSSGALAVGLFADTLLSLQGVTTKARRARPWSWSFDRAEARGGPPRQADEVLGDWVADVLWSLVWTEHGSFVQGLAELATRLAVARELGHRLHHRLGLRPDRAAAEAVMCAELVGALPLWESVRASIRAAWSSNT